MSKDFYQISLKVIMKNNRNEILILDSNPLGRFASFYDLPGGRIEINEFTAPFSDVIKREVAEEVGEVNFILNPKPVAVGRLLTPASISKSGSDIHVLYLFFEAKYISGEVTISHEHAGFKWIDFSKENPKKFLTTGNLEGVEMYLSKTTGI